MNPPKADCSAVFLARRSFIMVMAFNLVLLACTLFTPRPSVNPTPLPTPEIDLENVEIDYLYRSDLISIIYPLYGSLLDDFTIVTITNYNELPLKFIVSSEVQGFTGKSVDTVTVEPHSAIEVRQNPRLIAESFDKLNVQQPAEYLIQIDALLGGEQKRVLQESGETLVFARRDFPWSIPGMTDQEVFELLAAMVTPNDAAVEQLLRHAADYTESGIMWSGYSGADNDEDGLVWERLKAIWRAAQEVYGLTYLSTMVSYAPGDIQRIRLPRETLEQRAGNCIDLSLLFASAVEAIRLEAAIIGIPGHAFVGVRTDQTNEKYYFIETTMINSSSFSSAVNTALEEYQEAAEKIENGESRYNWLTIATAREKGILPLPWP